MNLSQLVLQLSKLCPCPAGYLMRLYHNVSEGSAGHAHLCDLYCRYPHLDLCDVTHLPLPWGNLQKTQSVRWDGRKLLLREAGEAHGDFLKEHGHIGVRWMYRTSS